MSSSRPARAVATAHAVHRPLLAIRGLSKSFGGHQVLKGVDLDIPHGSVTALIGASGSGKSTLLRCVNALEEYDEGTIHLSNEQLSYFGEGRRRRRFSDRKLAAERARIGMVFQGYNLFPHLTAEQNIVLGLRRVKKLAKLEAYEASGHWLAKVGLGDRREHYPYQLSGGQQQRVAIARAMAMEPELVLLDEVTSALDPELVSEVLTVIRDLAASGMTMLVVSHEMSFVRDVATTVAFMHQGRIEELESPEVIFARPSSAALKSFIARFLYAGRDNLPSITDGRAVLR
jgi:polar amino acid transport system ATP-binding protein